MSEVNQIGGGQVRGTISSIACELQNYQNADIDSVLSKSDTIDTEQQQKLREKNQLIAKLKKNLSTACTVARVVAEAKDKQREALNNAQKEYLEIEKKLKNQSNAITELSQQNMKLQNTIKCLTNTVQLGFKELQKFNCELPYTPSVVEQLKNIILCCGQYYADYCNEKEMCTKLKSKNSFLTKKIYILENNLDSLTKQLKYQQYLNMRHGKVEKENENPKFSKTIVPYSDLKIKQMSSSSMKNSIYKEIQEESKNMKKLEKKLDLSSHFMIVKKLLDDQDSLSKNLKIISQDFCPSQNVE